MTSPYRNREISSMDEPLPIKKLIITHIYVCHLMSVNMCVSALKPCGRVVYSSLIGQCVSCNSAYIMQSYQSVSAFCLILL